MANLEGDSGYIVYLCGYLSMWWVAVRGSTINLFLCSLQQFVNDKLIKYEDNELITHLC